jgi:hypothetical protein
MPGKEVKNWKVYESCMKDKGGSQEDKTYCARVANAVAAGTIKHSSMEDIEVLVRWGIEQALRDLGST